MRISFRVHSQFLSLSEYLLYDVKTNYTHNRIITHFLFLSHLIEQEIVLYKISNNHKINIILL